MARSRKSKITADASPLVSNPFAGLTLSCPQGADPGPDPEPPVPVETKSEAPTDLSVLIRRQRKGQGGKTVIYVEGLSAASLQEILPKIKKNLGCGARIEAGPEAALLVVGTKDLHSVERWMRSAGAKVKLGN